MIRLTIRNVRQSRNLSQTRLGKLSGVDQALISRIEAGEVASPGIETMLKLSRALSCSIDDLYEYEPKQEVV